MSNVNHPGHYASGKIEVIEFIEDKNLNFHLGNAVKYIARAGKKDPAKHQEDLEKAKWYLEREIETKFAYDIRRPNDMNKEAPLENGSTPRASSLKEIIDGVSSKDRNQVLLIIKGIIFNLFDGADFADWESIGDSIGEAIEKHPRANGYKTWELEEEERKELLELFADYNLGNAYIDQAIPDLKRILRPLIQARFDDGVEIGLLEKEIIDAPKVKPKPSKKSALPTPPVFPNDYLTRGGIEG